MHKTNIIPTLLLLVFCLAACTSQGQSKKTLQKEKKSIEKVAYGYLDAMGNYRIRDAYRFATPETQDKTLRFIEEKVMPITDAKYIKSETPAKITITGITIKSDTTAEAMFHKSTPSSERNNILQLVKRNGKWMADVQIDVPDIFNAPINRKSDGNDSTHHKKIILYEADKAPSSPR